MLARPYCSGASTSQCPTPSLTICAALGAQQSKGPQCLCLHPDEKPAVLNISHGCAVWLQLKKAGGRRSKGTAATKRKAAAERNGADGQSAAKVPRWMLRTSFESCPVSHCKTTQRPADRVCKMLRRLMHSLNCSPVCLDGACSWRCRHDLRGQYLLQR